MTHLSEEPDPEELDFDGDQQDLADRLSLRRVAGMSTQLADITEVEYRELQLERVVLVSVWTTGSEVDSDLAMAELKLLAETAGAQVLDALMQRRSHPDPATFIGRGKVDELREVVIATGADTVIADGELDPAQLRNLEDRLGVKVIDRCKLTILFEPGQEGLAEFLAEHEVEVVASLPCYSVDNVDRQRGKGVFDKSIAALQRLNALGYGREGSGRVLNLVYNPQGAVLPPPQPALEADYKRELGAHFGIVFNSLFALANMPIQRFGSMLISKGQFNGYIRLLKDNHRDANLAQVMCRSLISVDWLGRLYDCDFNQQLDLPMGGGAEAGPRHLRDLLQADADGAPIRVAEHCYGCTAGNGSSCGGALGG